jgi:hypothetical protein
VAFSCKGRGVCPSCSGRSMAQTAAQLADHVIPPVPVRQWVISVPKRLRGMLADRPAAVAAVTRIFLAAIERSLCTTAGVKSAARRRVRKSTRPGAGVVVELSPFEFLDQLTDLVPPPRKHRTGITGCSPRITSSGPPSRHLPPGTSPSGVMPRPMGMRSADMRQAEVPSAATHRRRSRNLLRTPRSFNSPPAPARPFAPSLLLLPTANKRPPGPPTGTDLRPTGVTPRSCRPQ